jgi:hypothetical protein
MTEGSLYNQSGEERASAKTPTFLNGQGRVSAFLSA